MRVADMYRIVIRHEAKSPSLRYLEWLAHVTRLGVRVGLRIRARRTA